VSFWEVTLNGVRCDTQTWDNALNLDGWGDEIFFGVQALVTDTQGNLLTWPDHSRSRIHGQAQGFVNRVPAGTRTATGGFQTGDEYPTPNPADRQNRTLMGDALPMRIWSGPLNANTLAAFTPTIWEWDGGQDVLTTLFQQLNTNGVVIAKAIAGIYSTLNPASGATVKPVVEIISGAVPALTAFLGSIIGQAGDRPIGTLQDAQGKRDFKPQTFILSEALGERIIANNFGEGPGIIEVEYSDSANIGGGTYRVWLEVRKYETPTDGTMAKENSRPEVYVFFGGARFWLPSPEWVLRYGGWGLVQTYPDGALLSVPTIPKDRTLLREWSAPEVWVIEAGEKRWVTAPPFLNQFGGWSMVRIVPDGALASVARGPDVTA
jgi:hypothetical protein